MVLPEHSSRISHELNYVFQLFAPACNIGLGDFFFFLNKTMIRKLLILHVEHRLALEVRTKASEILTR